MEIQIDSDGLSAIYAANQVVTLTRDVDQAVDGVRVAALVIAWQAFQPLQMNAINWTDQYYCFATTTPLLMNAVITMNSTSSEPMQIGFVYQFAQGQFIKQQQQDVNSYIVANASAGSFAFGMAQSATVNNVPTLAPFCIVPVLYNETAYFNPSDVIEIFLSSAGGAGALLPSPSEALDVLAQSGGGSEPTIGFDDETDTFYQIS
jgi:hypothetical protein